MSNDNFIGLWHTPGSESPLDMVGRYGGQDMDSLAAYVAEVLGMTESDAVLDVCCGNGVLTEQVAPFCKTICGLDFSQTLYAKALEMKSRSNSEYHYGDATEIATVFDGRVFDKCYMSLAFQYFNEETAGKLLQGLYASTTDSTRILIADIPDKEKFLVHKYHALKRLLFSRGSGDGTSYKRFNSIGYKIGYLVRHAVHMIRRKGGDDRIGWWWRKDDFAQMASKHGFQCDIRPCFEQAPHKHYRFDAVLTKRQP